MVDLAAFVAEHAVPGQGQRPADRVIHEVVEQASADLARAEDQDDAAQQQALLVMRIVSRWAGAVPSDKFQDMTRAAFQRVIGTGQAEPSPDHARTVEEACKLFINAMLQPANTHVFDDAQHWALISVSPQTLWFKFLYIMIAKTSSALAVFADSDLCQHWLQRVMQHPAAWRSTPEADLAVHLEALLTAQLAVASKRRPVVRAACELLVALPEDIVCLRLEDMRVDALSLDAIVEQLEHEVLRLEDSEDLRDAIAPYLMVLSVISMNDRASARHLRAKILPPRIDLDSAPEEGDGLRPALIRLMTSHVTHLNMMTSQLLYHLCEKDVNKLVRRTGMGNAAGLLSALGQLGAVADPSNDALESDSEDELEAQGAPVNPVTGRRFSPSTASRPAMTEEEEEARFVHAHPDGNACLTRKELSVLQSIIACHL
ncbi:uncharacterized protein MONBRDRAFT_26817 [Monosiga brevicollis MX1]|uniref:Uncharacterized protein n=1 Tax=Monosiga brevicollis TaxID=81824 RepID=A9V3L7_MONBE|nr:uncharacterized protein MONBRDRAFT_26817 [Monosiga brevicollis MX1]EDQ87836.1 predicted protein [Monosiga brevicollis MX1]|eukprot:XP_001747369.1 hypothetical protein [Monosiga brevicollis MX1]